MKSTEFKKIIKEAVKEAIHEELKDILLEAVRSSKSTPMVSENKNTPPSAPIHDIEQKRKLYENAISDTTLSFNSNNVNNFRPPSNFDSINGTLPPGEVDMSQIMAIMNAQ